MMPNQEMKTDCHIKGTPQHGCGLASARPQAETGYLFYSRIIEKNLYLKIHNLKHLKFVSHFGSLTLIEVSSSQCVTTCHKRVKIGLQVCNNNFKRFQIMPSVLLLFFDTPRIEHVFNPSHWDICTVHLRIDFSLRNMYELLRSVLNYCRLVK